MSTPQAQSGSGSSNTNRAPPVQSAKAMSVPSRIPPGACFHQNIVTVEIGTEKKAYLIHKDLLIFYSNYFRAAFNGSFTEATKRRISLSQESIDVFNIFNKFVYTRHLSDGTDTEVTWELLVKVWLFGDKHLIPALQNQVMSTMIEKSAKENVVIPSQQINLIYKNTVPGSPLRKIMVDWVAYRTNMSKYMAQDNVKKEWSKEALFDLVMAMGAKTKEDIGYYALPEEKKGKCYYHVHKDGEQCEPKLARSG